MAKIYVGCALTQAPEEFVREVEALKAQLRLEGHEVADFVGVVAGTATDVYETDIHKCVAECEFFLAVCDLPSIGLGWEIGVAVEKHGKPTLAVAHREAKVSRLPIGACCDRNQRYRFSRYDSLLDVVPMVSQFMNDLNTQAA
ncbi:MAG: hypothetical protein Q7R67_01760 [bacterium]|nr:hypothetical protein [bacterium]